MYYHNTTQQSQSAINLTQQWHCPTMRTQLLHIINNEKQCQHNSTIFQVKCNYYHNNTTGGWKWLTQNNIAYRMQLPTKHHATKVTSQWAATGQQNCTWNDATSQWYHCISHTATTWQCRITMEPQINHVLLLTAVALLLQQSKHKLPLPNKIIQEMLSQTQETPMHNNAQQDCISNTTITHSNYKLPPIWLNNVIVLLTEPCPKISLMKRNKATTTKQYCTYCHNNTTEA